MQHRVHTLARALTGRIPPAAGLLAAALILGAAGEAAPEEVLFSVSGGRFHLATSQIRVSADSAMRVEIASIRDGQDRSITDVSDHPSVRPSHYLRVSGVDYTLFPLDPEPHGVVVTDREDEFGSGVRIQLRGRGQVLGVDVEKKLELTVYGDHPDAVVTRATFRNLSPNLTLPVEALVSARCRLDRRLTNASQPAWSFLTVQPTQDNWHSRWVEIPLQPGYVRENWLVDPAVYGRGGQPFLALRGAETGVAIFSLEPVPQAIHLPCVVASDGRVHVSIEQRPAASHGQYPGSLAPGDSMATILTGIAAHRGDYFDAARRYGSLLQASLAAAGKQTFGPWPERAFEPYWKTWGFGENFTLAQIYALLDGLADLGMPMVGLDGGWFDRFGAWNPNTAPGKFPGGEPDIIEFVDELHTPQWGRAADHGFKTSIWWNPPAWEAGSGVSAAYLVKNPSGGIPLDNQGHGYLCPAYEPAVQEMIGTAVRFLGSWGFDGLYIDGGSIRNVPPCYDAAHAHPAPIASIEALPDLYRRIEDAARTAAPDALIIFCECSGPHDPYKMAYGDVEDASDPLHDVDVRRKIKFSKALRGPGAPFGDGYIDPAPGNYLSGTFANSVGVGSVLTSFYTSPDALGQTNWERWMAISRNFDLQRGDYLNLYDISFEKPEGHAVHLESGVQAFAFYDEPPDTTTVVPLRGLEPGVPYDVYEMDTLEPIGSVTGPGGSMTVEFKRQGPGMPAWCLLVAVPPMVPLDGIVESPNATPWPRYRLALHPNPVASSALLEVWEIAAPPAGLGASVPSSAAPVTIDIFDVLGRHVRSLIAPPRDGRGLIEWDVRDRAGRPVANGRYQARIRGGSVSVSFLVLR